MQDEVGVGARRSEAPSGRCPGTPRSRAARPRASSSSARSAGARSGGRTRRSRRDRRRSRARRPSSRRRRGAGSARRSREAASPGSRPTKPFAPATPTRRPVHVEASSSPDRGRRSRPARARRRARRAGSRASRGCRAPRRPAWRERAARLRDDGRLLRLPVGGQVAREQDEVDVVRERAERLLRTLGGFLARVDVAGRGDADGPLQWHASCFTAAIDSDSWRVPARRAQ